MYDTSYMCPAWNVLQGWVDPDTQPRNLSTGRGIRHRDRAVHEEWGAGRLHHQRLPPPLLYGRGNAPAADWLPPLGMNSFPPSTPEAFVMGLLVSLSCAAGRLMRTMKVMHIIVFGKARRRAFQQCPSTREYETFPTTRTDLR